VILIFTKLKRYLIIRYLFFEFWYPEVDSNFHNITGTLKWIMRANQFSNHEHFTWGYT